MLTSVIDAHTKWPEIEIIKSITASEMIKVFHKLFSRFGLPHHLVSDNGTQYTSAEFAEFLRPMGIKHSFSPVKHPATNGAAENFVKVFKKKIKAMMKDGKNTTSNRHVPFRLSNDKAQHHWRNTLKINV